MFGLAEHEREDEREHGRGEQGQAGQVERAAGLALAGGSARAPTASRATPIGTFTRNTGRQLEPNRFALISRPPTICPTTAPPASTAE